MKKSKKSKIHPRVYYEYNRESNGISIISSKIRDVTYGEFEKARKKYKETRKCSCHYCVNTGGFLYESIQCAICGKGLGAV